MLHPTKESYLPLLEGSMSDNSLILLGKRIRELRTKRGLSQERLSELCGVSSRHISEMERGESNPSFQIMEQVTSALGISMKDLFDFEHLRNEEELREEAIAVVKNIEFDKLGIIWRIIRVFAQ